MIRIKRIYDAPEATDGMRILVDRLWPRGVSKEKAQLDEWLKDIAPSPDLRVWFGHKPERFHEFSQKYIAELADNPAVDHIHELHKTHKNITLLYAAKSPTVNHAVVLREFLENK